MNDVDNDVYLYCDGEVVAQDLSGITNNFTDNSHPLLIGYSGQSAEYFDGRIRDVRFYDHVLSAEQVKSLYLGRYLPTPLYAYKLDEGTGNASGWGTNNAGGASDATVNGADWVTANFKVNGSARIGTNGSI